MRVILLARLAEMKNIRVVTVTIDELRCLLVEAVATALDEQRQQAEIGAQGLSCRAAAKLARRRRDAVAAAMKSGSLRAKRSGRRGWLTSAGDVREWIQRGCPTTQGE